LENPNTDLEPVVSYGIAFTGCESQISLQSLLSLNKKKKLSMKIFLQTNNTSKIANCRQKRARKTSKCLGDARTGSLPKIP